MNRPLITDVPALEVRFSVSPRSRALAFLLKVNITNDVTLPRTLSSLLPGQRGFVQHVGGSRALRRRLMELGLLPGTEVEVVRAAPMLDPIELSLRGYRLSIRLAEAALVELSPALELSPSTAGRARLERAA